MHQGLLPCLRTMVPCSGRMTRSCSLGVLLLLISLLVCPSTCRGTFVQQAITEALSWARHKLAALTQLAAPLSGGELAHTNLHTFVQTILFVSLSMLAHSRWTPPSKQVRMQASGHSAWMRKAMLWSGGWRSSHPAPQISCILTAGTLKQTPPSGASGGENLDCAHLHTALLPLPLYEPRSLWAGCVRKGAATSGSATPEGLPRALHGFSGWPTE